MFPTLRQRTLILASVVISAALLSFVADGWGLAAFDGSDGWSLFSAEASWPVAWLVVLAGVVPAVALGLLCAAAGHALAGPFVLGATITILAVQGGTMLGWRWRMEEVAALPGAYTWLILEMLLWQIPLLALAWLSQRWRGSLRDRLPALLREPDPTGPADGPLMHWHTLASAAVCAALAGLLAHFVVASPQSPQVILGLIAAFAAGGMAGRLLFPEGSAWGMLLSPLLVAGAGYAHVLIRFSSQSQLVLAWQDADLSGLALALPIHYAGAGLAGVSLGIAWALAMEHSREPESKGVAG